MCEESANVGGMRARYGTTLSRKAFLGTTAAATALATLRARARAAMTGARIMLGDDVLLADAWRDLRDARIGIITNQSGVTSRLESVVDALRRNPALRVTALFAPEHSLRGDRPAGSYVPSYTDERTGLPVYSLYGPTRIPDAHMLANVDVLLFDIQDVGCRTYTFVSTMAEAMKAARMHDKEIWILDRPNPIGGAMVEGPVLEPRYASFIGLYPVAMRHGMTIGELARLYNEAFGIGARLRVIPMRGWRRSMLWNETGLAWVPTSPNIPTWQTTLLYPATGLLDGTGLNNGVGTAAPFAYAGARDVDSFAYARHLAEAQIPGIRFMPASWSPLCGAAHATEFHGVELMIADAARFPAVRTAVELIVAMRETAPRVVRPKRATMDRNWGTAAVREGIEAGFDTERIVRDWEPRLAAFRRLRERYLLYD